MKKIAVLSTKGGVGKSTISIAIAKSIAGAGKNVALIDADITNPNIPVLTGTERTLADLELTDTGIVPIEIPIKGKGSLKMFSIGYIMPPSQSIIWDGDEAARTVIDMMHSVLWGDVEYMIFDMPPQTSNIARTVFETFGKADRVIVVTTAREPAIEGATRTIDAVSHLLGRDRIGGVIVNMAHFKCPECGAKHPLGLSAAEIKKRMGDIKVIKTLPLLLKNEGVELKYMDIRKYIKGGII